jgi:hypothetical protein
MKYFLPFVLFLISLLSAKAQNLVPNPSFEDTLLHSGCITTLASTQHWFNPTAATPDLFTYKSTCINSSLNNPFGYQLPKTGLAYAGIYGFLTPTREYLAIRFDSSLTNGCNYYIEFYISLANSSGLACDKIGVAFTNDTSGFSLISGALPLAPVVQSPAGILMSDTLNWMKISGSFIANGTEEFIIIGNFYDQMNTYWDTVNVFGDLNSAYYYIDDVLMLPCNVSSTLEDENLNNGTKVIFFPVPATNVLYFELSEKPEHLSIEITDLSGRLFWKKNENILQGRNTIHLNHFDSGTYLLRVVGKQNSYSYKILVFK